MTLTTRSGNRVSLAFVLIENHEGEVNVVWENYPPSAADVKECERWIERDVILNYQGKVRKNLFDPPSGGQN